MATPKVFDPNYPMTIKDQPYPRRLQVTLEGGPFHGQRIDDWVSATSDARWFVRALFETPLRSMEVSESYPPYEWAPNVRTVRYELQRWNEAGTAGIAVCVDDGKPKCKHKGVPGMAGWTSADIAYFGRLHRDRDKGFKVESVLCEAGCGAIVEYKVSART